MIRVIVADDEYKVCQLICQLINWEELGMQLVGTASNGMEALQMIDAEQPDLVLTDIRMPGYDGMELLKRARQIKPNMELIIISGYSHFEYAQTAIRYGVSDYILKPINKETLNATLQKVRQRYLEHQMQVEEDLEQKKQQATDQARLRETLWRDLELGETPGEMEHLNEQYRYHFAKGLFQIFLIQADIRDYKELNEDYAGNVMELLNSKLSGLFQKHVASLCIDSEIFKRNGRVAGILNYEKDKKAEVRNALESLISALSMELHAFENMRFHLAVSSAREATADLSQCIPETELVMEQRLFRRNGLFLEELPENLKADLDSLYKMFSTRVRESMDLQSISQLDDAVVSLHAAALSKGLNGHQMLHLVQDAYHLFMLSSMFQSEYHFANKEEMEATFKRQSAYCCSHEQLFSFLKDACKKNMTEACSWLNAEKTRPITQAKQYIREHYAEALSLEEVSAVVGFSSSYFSTLFRRETGKNFLEYLTDVRIEEAKKLLRESRETIETVSRLVGMNDYKRFSKIFRKSTGISPKEYRKLYS